MIGSRSRDAVRRTLGVLVTASLLGAGIAVAAGLGPASSAPSVAGTPADSDRTTVPARTIEPTSPASPSPTPTATGTPADGPGIALTASPNSDGTFSVAEVVDLPAAVTEIVLRPAPVDDAGTGFESLRPTAVDLEVRAGGQAVAVPAGPVRGGVTLRWSGPTPRLELSYRLTQVSVTSPHARAGRALAALGSLVDGMPDDVPVTVVVNGDTVLSLSCPQLPLAEASCGSGAAPQVQTARPIPFDRSRVLVQYDRPARNKEGT